jgi:hypothetical protein
MCRKGWRHTGTAWVCRKLRKREKRKLSLKVGGPLSFFMPVRSEGQVPLPSSRQAGSQA